jgi:hypothetical protein
VLSAIIAASLIAIWSREAVGQAPPPDPTPVAEDVAGTQEGQVLTQGPVHEAFAAPVVHDPKAAPVVSREPPAAIHEQPPDQKPAGQNIHWIPGYWGWDPSRNDFVWVSGLWREPPPGTQWVPGYWHSVDSGFQWVPGAWMPASSPQSSGQDQATYLPAPPQSLESGPNVPQPGPNVAWTPGYWSWQASGYVWRPGFWAAVQPDWIWMPAHYVWTPSGYLFVPGYWDLPVANRGILFAPMYYPQLVYAQPGFAFTPSISIVGSAVTGNLFVQATTGQYLFGNFYAANYVSVGIVPWFSFSFVAGRPAYYDPLFAYYAVVSVRQNPRWVAQVREAYVLRRDHVAMRPPGTYIEQTRLIERNVTINRNITVVDRRAVAMPLKQLAAERDMKLVHVAAAERQQLQRQAVELHQFREQRQQLEREAARGGMAARPRTMALPHSPIAARHPAAAHPDGAGARAAAARPSEPFRHPAGASAAVAHRPEPRSNPFRGMNTPGERAGFGPGGFQPRPSGAGSVRNSGLGIRRPAQPLRGREPGRPLSEEERRRRPGS